MSVAKFSSDFNTYSFYKLLCDLKTPPYLRKFLRKFHIFVDWTHNKVLYWKSALTLSKLSYGFRVKWRHLAYLSRRLLKHHCRRQWTSFSNCLSHQNHFNEHDMHNRSLHIIVIFPRLFGCGRSSLDSFHGFCKSSYEWKKGFLAKWDLN